MFPFEQNGSLSDDQNVHEFYMAIINSIPSIIYWIDASTNLVGCNSAFIQLLGLEHIKDLDGSPYHQMEALAKWNKERVEQFKLDDMGVLFTGKAVYNLDEQPVTDKNGHTLYFQASRVPHFNKAHKTIGLTVVLTAVTANKTKAETIQPVSSVLTHSKNMLNEGHMPAVLMIEDNVIAQNVEKSILAALNCQVDVAATGDKALKLFDAGKYDLVLMDIGLEETSGYVVAKQLRKMEQNTEYHVPIIALTGFEADKVKVDCKHYSMEGAITKPLTSEQAEQLIQHYIYHKDVPVQGLKSC